MSESPIQPPPRASGLPKPPPRLRTDMVSAARSRGAHFADAFAGARVVRPEGRSRAAKSVQAATTCGCLPSARESKPVAIARRLKKTSDEKGFFGDPLWTIATTYCQDREPTIADSCG